MEKNGVDGHSNAAAMTPSSVVFFGIRFFPLNSSCGEFSLIDPISAFEVGTYEVLCGRFNRVEERILGVK